MGEPGGVGRSSGVSICTPRGCRSQHHPWRGRRATSQLPTAPAGGIRAGTVARVDGLLGGARRLGVAARWRFKSLAYVDLAPDHRATVALLGSARSGTTWVGEVIDRHHDHRVVFEPLRPNRVPVAKAFANGQYLRRADTDPRYLDPMRAILTGRVRNPWADHLNHVVVARRRLVKEIRANLLAPWLVERFPGHAGRAARPAPVGGGRVAARDGLGRPPRRRAGPADARPGPPHRRAGRLPERAAAPVRPGRRPGRAGDAGPVADDGSRRAAGGDVRGAGVAAARAGGAGAAPRGPAAGRRTGRRARPAVAPGPRGLGGPHRRGPGRRRGWPG